MGYEHHAIWWVPRPGTDLARFGAAWTGWCADGGTSHAEGALSVSSRRGSSQPGAGLPGALRLSGLHAPLGAPFRLAPGRSLWALEGALTELARDTRPIRLPRLAVETHGGRTVLAPRRPDEALAQLLAGIAATVRPFLVTPEFGALTGTGAIAAGGLILPDVDESPDIAPDFTRTPTRFCLPLTDERENGGENAPEIAAGLHVELAPILAGRPVLADIALIGDPGHGRPWRLLERFDLDGEAPARDARAPAGMDCRGPNLLAPLPA